MHQHPVRVPPDKPQPPQTANIGVKFEKYVEKYCAKSSRSLDRERSNAVKFGLKNANRRLDAQSAEKQRASDSALHGTAN